MNKTIFTLIAVVILVSVNSCKKDISSTPQPPIIPLDTVVSFLPSSFSYTSTLYPEDSVTMKVNYVKDEHAIEIYPADSSVTQPFELLSYKYYYTPDGYFIKKETYDIIQKKIIELMTAERDNSNVLKRVLYEAHGPTKSRTDTFNFSFADSLSYKIMKIENVSHYYSFTNYYFTTAVTFQNTESIKERTVFSSGSTPESSKDTSWESYDYSYDASERKTSSTYLIYHSPEDGFSSNEYYMYDDTKTGLDSFYKVLGGVDGYYLLNYFYWVRAGDMHFLFSPLLTQLSNDDNSTPTSNLLIDLECHRFGALKEVHVVEKRIAPINFDPTDEIFAFQNSFDSHSRIIESRIFRGGTLKYTWKITY